MEVSDEMIDQLRKQVGKLFVVGFDGLTVNEQVKSLIHEYHVGVLFYLRGTWLIRSKLDS